MFSYIPKTLVYLAAALISLQPLAVLSCGCDSHGQHGADANTHKEQAKVESVCCGRGDDCRCSSHSRASSCCTKTLPAPPESCCDTGSICSCGADNSSPPAPLAPLPSRGYSVNDAIQPSAIALFSSADHPCSAGFLFIDRPSAASGLARCIVLCRFRL